MGEAVEQKKRHLLTVLLEDYFHVGAFNSIIQRGQWYRFETRFEQNTLKTLDLLDRFDVSATFFVLGWVADQNPDLVKEIARRGHEIASRGYYHRGIRQMTPQEFREDLRRSREALEKASGTSVHGYRAAHRLNYHVDQWALDVLADEGYAYDSSLMPTARSIRNEPRLRFAHLHTCEGGKELWEFPYSTYKIPGSLVPISGGNFFRQLPHTLVKRAVRDWDERYSAPFVMYFHVWELDPEQPRISAASPINRIRHYRKLDKMSWVLEDYLSSYKFVGMGEYLGLSREHRATAAEALPPVVETPSMMRAPTAYVSAPLLPPRVPVSVVVPCYNEQLILPYLANTLKSVETRLSARYDLRFIFVDDCSTDRTWASLQEIFGGRENCTLLRHPENRGVAAGILTGLRHAETEIVCSIDCDCTYDPHELAGMIPLLADDVDMVTASPYHPLGGVRNVPAWRLSLSKASSFLYRQVLRQKLHTYTSCFRVYRRSAVARLSLCETGFLGVAEMLGRLDLRGARVVEFPTTLEVRLFGWSKMKIVRTIAGHLKLLTRLLALRLSSTGTRLPQPRIADPALESRSSSISVISPK
jgi:polysaccharide deacetylase family protein (PEP-CTERM system associated)